MILCSEGQMALEEPGEDNLRAEREFLMSVSWSFEKSIR